MNDLDEDLGNFDIDAADKRLARDKAARRVGA